MQSPIPATRAAEAAQLQSAVERFLAAGNAIEEVPIGKSKDFNPLRTAPIHDDDRPPVSPMTPKEARKQQAHRGYDIRQAHAVKSARARAERDAIAGKIRAMAAAGEKTVNIAKVLGIAARTVRRTATENGIALNRQRGRSGSMHDDTVRAIRAAVEGRMTYKDAAKHHGCSVPAIRDIVTGVTYGHVI